MVAIGEEVVIITQPQSLRLRNLVGQPLTKVDEGAFAYFERLYAAVAYPTLKRIGAYADIFCKFGTSKEGNKNKVHRSRHNLFEKVVDCSRYVSG